MEMERKTFPFELEEKGLDMEERTFKMFAAVYGNFDGQDIIEYGAGKKTLKEGGHRVKVFWIHDFQEPIGKPIEIREVSKSKLPPKLLEKAPDATGGLYVYGKLSKTRRGDEALTLLYDGVLDEGSIGYQTVKEDLGEIDGQSARIIKEYRLFDVSLVPLAMNPAAIVTAFKLADLAKDIAERVELTTEEAYEELIKMWMKIEETEDSIRIPVSGESGKHGDHKVRWITVSPKEGIKGLYCVDCKKIITYVFDKEKGWTVEKAKQWVKEHESGKGSEPAEMTEQVIEERGEAGKRLVLAKLQSARLQQEELEARMR